MARLTPEVLAKLSAMAGKERQVNEGYDRAVPGLMQTEKPSYTEEEIQQAKQILLTLWGENEDTFHGKTPEREDALYWMNRKAAEQGLLHGDASAQQIAVREALNALYAFGEIQSLMDNPLVTDIRLVADLCILFKVDGVIHEFEKIMSTEDVTRFISRQLVGLGKSFDWSNPRLDARLKDGSRLHVRGGSAGYQHRAETQWGEKYHNPDKLIVNIRKGLGNSVLTLEDLLGWKMFDEPVYELLRFIIEAGFSVIFSGGTGSGKTTLLQALTAFILREQDLFIVEEEPEIRALMANKRVFRYWNTAPNPNGKGGIGEFENLMDILRSNADNVSFGEVRTPVSAYWGLQVAMTVSYLYMATLHGISVTSAVRRFVDLASGYEAAKSLHSIASSFSEGVRFVVTARKVRIQGRETRRITEIGMVLPEYQRSRGIQFYRLVQWNPMTDDWTFHGVPKWLEEESHARDIALPASIAKVNSGLMPISIEF